MQKQILITNNLYKEFTDGANLLGINEYQKFQIETRVQYITCPKDNDQMAEISTVMENFQKGFQL